MLTAIKGEIDSNTIIVGDFNTPLTSMNRSSRQKINKETLASNDTTDLMDLIVIYRTFHPRAAEYTFFSSVHETFSRMYYMVRYKTSLGIFKKTGTISSIFSDHNAMRLKINYKKKTAKTTDTWSLNNTLLHKQWVTNELKKEI